MENKQIFLEKIADTNVKDEFLTGESLDSKILDIAFKTIPILKDQEYKLSIPNKSNDSGYASGIIDIKIPEKRNPGASLKLSIPILIVNYKLKPLDTFVINQVAYPITDSSLKELLNDPDNFRRLTQKEIRESKLLSKLADEFYEDTLASVKKIAEEEEDNSKKYLSLVYYRSLEEYHRLRKEAEEYSEPIKDYILQRKNDFDFDLYYMKIAQDNTSFQFFHENQDSASIRLLLEATGYNSVKMADEINSGKQLYLKAPVYNQTANPVRSMRFDPKTLKNSSTFSDVKKGPVEVMDSKGKLLKGFVYDLFSFSGKANNFPSSKIFVDLDKNYNLAPSFEGAVSQEDFVLKEDTIEPGDTGVFLDLSEDNAFGLIKVLNVSNIANEAQMIEVQIQNKKYSLKQEEMLKKYVINGNEILVPSHYKWVALHKKISLVDQSLDKNINTKIAETSYTIYKNASDIRITKYIGDQITTSKVPSILVPSGEHLKLLLNRLNFLSTNVDDMLTDVEKQKPVTFSTNFPILQDSIPSNDLGLKEVADRPLVNLKVLEIVKTASEPVLDLFPSLFDLSRNPDFCQRIDGIIKEGATTDTLDSIFSLGLINEINSAVFIQCIDKLKFVLSYLAALRLYIRYGWEIALKEGDVTMAIDALAEIIQKLELVKTQKILDKQLNMQMG